MVLNNLNIQKISDLFLLTFPELAERGVLEVYYGDGYADFPMKYYDTSTKLVYPIFQRMELS